MKRSDAIVKKIVLMMITVVLVVILSSCAVNVFKPVDKPSSNLTKAKSALDAADKGNSQVSINLSSDVITSVASTSAGTKMDLYDALTGSATSSKAKQVIEQTASDVKNIKSQIESGKISSNSTTASVVKNAAIAMVRSISQIKNLSITTVVGTLLDILPQSNSVSVKDASISFDSTKVIKSLTILLSLSRDMPTMDLLGELSSLLSVYGGNGEFNWDVSNVIYNSLYVSTALFDSNGDGVLTTSDDIFNYVWDKKNNRFKDSISQEEFEKMLNVKLGTYGNSELSQKVVEKMHESVQSARDALNHIPPSISVDTASIEKIIDKTEMVLNILDSGRLSFLKTLGELLGVIETIIQ